METQQMVILNADFHRDPLIRRLKCKLWQMTYECEHTVAGSEWEPYIKMLATGSSPSSGPVGMRQHARSLSVHAVALTDMSFLYGGCSLSWLQSPFAEHGLSSSDAQSLKMRLTINPLLISSIHMVYISLTVLLSLCSSRCLVPLPLHLHRPPP